MYGAHGGAEAAGGRKAAVAERPVSVEPAAKRVRGTRSVNAGTSNVRRANLAPRLPKGCCGS